MSVKKTMQDPTAKGKQGSSLTHCSSLPKFQGPSGSFPILGKILCLTLPGLDYACASTGLEPVPIKTNTNMLLISTGEG